MPQTAPIDLTKAITNPCNLKCSYSFSYSPTNFQITNRGSYLSIKVADTNMPPVIYNDQNYNVKEVRLYHQSIHTYGTKRADAELLILHTSITGNSKLFVSVPIMKSGTTTAESASLFDFILSETQRTANNEGGQTIYTNPVLSLGKFVPMKPYYSYIGSLPYSPFNGSYNYVVFHKNDAITMSPQGYKILQSINPTDNGIMTRPNNDGIFYNSSGPVPPNKGEIYIDCRPTGDDGEVLVPAKTDSGGVLENEYIKKMMSSSLIKVVIGAVLMIIIWLATMKIINGIAANATKAASFAIKNASKLPI
jgi:carbonic anhydrase